ncbi:MAG TPA: hypothetical protein VK474_07140 [Chthoniobacterales bacterium]|nr:hypothetical protein [Chthoniobacterales bacterium]
MIRTVYAAGLGGIFLLVAHLQAAAPPERSLSSSRQFIVYGLDARRRGGICELAERCKQDVLHLLGPKARDNWQTPIVIQARYPEADRPEVAPAQLRVSQTGHGLKFQLDFHLTADLSLPRIERELLRAIFLEMIYRDRAEIPPGTALVEPPDWLLEGTLALAPARDSTFIAQSLATAAAGKTLTLEEFLRQKWSLLDSPSRTLYRAYSAALVSVLAENEAGRLRLARFLSDLPDAGNDALADLKAHFPEVGARAGEIENAWENQISRLDGSARYRVLSCAETERELGELLRVHVGATAAPKIYALEEFPRFVRDPAALQDLKRLTTELLLLSARANPLYRPIIGEYQEIAALLVRRKTRKIPRRLAELRETREHLSRQMNAIADYLNWFEATQARTLSGAFREYLRAAELAQEPEPRRRDPISVYLDALETQF